MVWKIVFTLLFCCKSAVSVQRNINAKDELENFLGTALTLKDTLLPPIAVPLPENVIRQHGYPVEKHIIETEDGYLLAYYRIPHGQGRNSSSNKPYPVLLHHGLFTSSLDWVVTGPNDSLAYILADDGYDVWMGNLRGNTYSRGHVSLSTLDPAYWNFSYHERGIYDAPAAIDYILNATKAEKLVYIGHSLGTTMFFVMAATRPEYSEKVLFQISLAPVGAIPHATSALRLIVPALELLKSVPPNGPFTTHNIITLSLVKLLCGTNAQPHFILCRAAVAAMSGYDPSQFNEKSVPVISDYFMSGNSLKDLIHLGQLIMPGTFSYFDYGPAENIKIYNNVIPPSYNLSAISVPIKFYQGLNDILGDVLDAQLLYRKISRPMGLTYIDFAAWSHLDFVYATDVRKYLNEQLLLFIRNLTSKPQLIDTIVQTANRERNQTAAPPVNEPFNETSFINQYNKLPGFNLFSKALKSLLSIFQIAGI